MLSQVCDGKESCESNVRRKGKGEAESDVIK